VGEKVLILNARKIMQKTHEHEFILVAIEDITEHRQATRLLEERESWFRNMANQVPVMLWVAGPDKNFTFLNNTWVDFTGRTIMEETGNGWTDGVHKDDLHRVLAAFHSSFIQRKPYRIKYRMKRHDGEYRWILNTAAPAYGPNKEFTGYAGSCIEIHDEKLMNELLE
jgi:two-component system CheB/CheR fusion protein